jgi:hypothetical protein
MHVSLLLLLTRGPFLASQPICLESVGTSLAALSWCKLCRNNFHAVCINQCVGVGGGARRVRIAGRVCDACDASARRRLVRSTSSSVTPLFGPPHAHTRRWAAAKRAQGAGGAVPCPFCRGNWVNPDAAPAAAGGGGGAAAGGAAAGGVSYSRDGYANFGAIAGLSSRRDTSTYHRPPERYIRGGRGGGGGGRKRGRSGSGGRYSYLRYGDYDDGEYDDYDDAYDGEGDGDYDFY